MGVVRNAGTLNSGSERNRLNRRECGGVEESFGMVPDMIPFNPWGKHVVGSYKYLERTSGRFSADHAIAPSLLLQTLRPRYQHGVSNQDFQLGILHGIGSLMHPSCY